jgi:hypothetical protein
MPITMARQSKMCTSFVTLDTGIEFEFHLRHSAAFSVLAFFCIGKDPVPIDLLMAAIPVLSSRYHVPYFPVLLILLCSKVHGVTS